MSVIWKIRLQFIRLWWILRRGKKLAKKYKKEPEMYTLQYRNDYLIKKAKKVIKAANIELEVIGFENIPKQSTIMTPNHGSSFDPLFIMAALENPSTAIDDLNQKASFVSKIELKNSKFKHFMSLIDVAYIDRKKPKESLEVMNEFLTLCKNTQRHVVIFPEGTRTRTGELQEFKTGAFRMAKRAYMPILPVTISNNFGVTNFKERKGKWKVQVIFHEPIKPSSFLTVDHGILRDQVKAIVAKDYKISPQAKWSSEEERV